MSYFKPGAAGFFHGCSAMTDQELSFLDQAEQFEKSIASNTD